MMLSQNNKITLSTILISIIAWYLLLFNPGRILGVDGCQMCYSGGATFKMFWDMHSMPSQLASWLLMVLAMMMPKLIIPIQYIYYQSLKKNRLKNALFFFAGYLFDWMIVGVIMILIIDLSKFFMPKSYVPAFVTLCLAVVWQFSPSKQRFINLGHKHYSIATFGFRSQLESFLFGVKHGMWCVGSGWALMLFPMLLPSGHNLAMFIVTIMMVSEHLEQPQEPRWKVDWHLKLLEMARTQMKFKILPLLRKTS